MREIVVLPISPIIYSILVFLYLLLLMFAVIGPNTHNQKMAATVGAVAAGIAIWQLTLLTIVGVIPEGAIDVITLQAAALPLPRLIGDVYPIVKLSALMPVIPGILAARPLKNLIIERLRHE